MTGLPLPRRSLPDLALPRLSLAGWCLLLLLPALGSQLPALALPAWGALVLALVSRRLPPRPWSAALRLGLLGLSLALAGWQWGWLESPTLRLGLLLVLALKWAEARRPGEYVGVAAGALVAGAIGLLQWGEGTGLALLLLQALLFLVVLDLASLAPGTGAPASAAPFPPAWSLLRRNLGRLGLALPMTAVLFLFFPRIPGPLWDIGLSFGLPLSLSVEKSSQGLGVSTRLKPGQSQTQAGARESQPVLVAEFEHWVPPTSLLYWRGPVYYDFDGQEWRLDPSYESQGRSIMRQGWSRIQEFTDTLRRKNQEVRYKIRLTPHERLWLYGLDLPASLTTESFVGPDWQVLSHRPVETEMSYELSSYLDWEGGGQLAEPVRQRALALPPEGNPRLRALGRELAAAPDRTSLLRLALGPLGQGDYKLRDRFTFQAGPDALDRFWFDSREGNADLYAGTFVYLMRAAGVPARLVTGYRGGKLMALTDYVVVKRSHAHAWVEIWDETRGWQRVDPVDLIAPERFAGSAAKPRAAPQPAPAAPPKPAAPARQEQGPGPQAGQFQVQAMAPAAAPGTGWQWPDLGRFMGRWIFRLDGETQQALLGGQGGGLAWVWLLLLAALGSALVLAAGLGLGRWRELRRLPPPRRHWERLCRLLASRGLGPRPGECPRHYALRVGQARPLWAAPLADLASAYTDWRYAPGRDDAPARLQAAARRLYNLVMADTGRDRQDT